MARLNTFERRFDEDNHAAPGSAEVFFASPVGLLLLIILLSGFSSTMSRAGEAAAIMQAALPSGEHSESRSSVPRRSVTAEDIRSLVSDPAVRDFRGLSEYSWDFNDPDGVPGFGPLTSSSKEFPVAQSGVK